MTDLLTKLQNATEGSRELDAEVWCVDNKFTFLRFERSDRYGYHFCMRDQQGRELRGAFEYVPHYTTNIQATKQFHEKQLHPATGRTSIVNYNHADVRLWNKETDMRDTVAHHKSEPLAWLIAIMRALESQKEMETENGN